MTSPPFGRLLTAMATPFDDGGALDLEVARQLARHLVDTGSDGIVVSGTTGESPTLTDVEKIALFGAVVEAVDGRVPVIAGTGSNDTAHSVHLSEAAAECGIAALMAVTPYYNRPSQGGLVAHFTAIAESTSLPVVLYNIPSRTGRLIEASTVIDLSQHPKIVAVKDSTGDAWHTVQVVAGAAEGFAVYSGDDISTLAIMSVGGVGVVSVAAHLVGRQMKLMIEAFCDGKVEEAAAWQSRLFEIFRLLFIEPSPMPLKAALPLVGINAGAPRLPLVAAQPSTLEALREALATLA